MRNVLLIICAAFLRSQDHKIIRSKVILLMILSLMILPLISGCGGEQSSDRSNEAKDVKKIVIGLDDFAPMGFRDEHGEIVGFDIDLAKEAARRMGVEPEFKIISWDSKNMEVIFGHIDMIWNGLDITPEGQKDMIFTRPYMDNRQIFLVKKGNPQEIYSVDDLAGKNVGTQSGSNSETYIDQNAELRDTFAEFKTYSTINEEFAALESDEIDVLIIDEIAARYEVNKHRDAFEIVDTTIGSVTEFGIGFRRGNTELRDKVQKVFDEMIADGTARKISEKWFQADLIKSPN